MMLLMAAGCASIGEGYTTRYGLTNPDNPPVHPDLMDETYAGGIVGQRDINEYEKKYREKDIFRQTEPDLPEKQDQQPQ
ncbi:MAG: hypothetical protein JSV16_12905 [Candidatus Hydrogenedentota bacterium]|nr:MAG: hypothetical protein JSV16_12905 [Candidatus Hydrogenedentota bacterium]